MQPDNNQPPAQSPAANDGLPAPATSTPADQPITRPTPNDAASILTASAPLINNGSITGLAPANADDTDLIEKEWVNKAKAIVMQTKDDPHTQSQQVTRFKADYLKKRYNKDIKISDTPA